MGKATIKIPMITLRIDNDDLATMRPRFSPGPRLRKPPFNMKGEDLRHGADGPWFTLTEAKAWSEDRQALIAAIAGATPREARKLRQTGHETVGQLFLAWLQEPNMKGKEVIEGKKHRRALAKNTVDNYAKGARRIEELDGGTIWNAPAVATTPKVWAGVFDRLEIKHGLSSARGARSAASAMFTWALSVSRFKGAHPIHAMTNTMPVPEARIRYGTVAEMAHFIRAADIIGRPEIGDSIALGLWTAQRQNDRLALVEDQDTDQGIAFRQHKKRGQPLLIPPSPELRIRLRAIRHRRRDWKVSFPQIVVDERQRQPFNRDWYVKVFAKVRTFAATGKVSALDHDGRKTGALVEARHEISGEPVSITPMPSLADFRDQDLRDTAVTWLALAGCSIPQIASITGHSLKTIDQVLKHYLGMHPELSSSAITRLVAWHDEKGEGK